MEIEFSALKTVRVARSLTQEELAEQLGTTKTAVSRWERNVAMPSSYFRGRLCAFFAMTAEDLGLNPQEKKRQVGEVLDAFEQLQMQYLDIQRQLTRIENLFCQLSMPKNDGGPVQA